MSDGEREEPDAGRRPVLWRRERDPLAPQSAPGEEQRGREAEAIDERHDRIYHSELKGDGEPRRSPDHGSERDGNEIEKLLPTLGMTFDRFSTGLHDRQGSDERSSGQVICSTGLWAKWAC